jgi:hypothetical protein
MTEQKIGDADETVGLGFDFVDCGWWDRGARGEFAGFDDDFRPRF